MLLLLSLIICCFVNGEADNLNWKEVPSSSVIIQHNLTHSETGNQFSYADSYSSANSGECAIAYPQNLAYRRGSVVNIIPTFSCAVSSWSIAPPLPSYLHLDPESGVISGEVEEVFEAVFTITAETAQGEVEVEYILCVLSDGCEAEDIWPFTLGQEVASIPCPDEYNYVGTLYRACEGYFAPQWGPVTGNCSLGAPYDLEYPYKRVQAYLNHDLSPVIPTYRGRGSEFSLDSPLPSGLEMSSESGVITGSPVGEEGCWRVEVSLHNEAGSCATHFEVCVVDGKTGSSPPRRVLPLLWNVCSVAVAVVTLFVLVCVSYCTLKRFCVC